MSDTPEVPMPSQKPIGQEDLTSMIDKWMEYARVHLTPIRIKSAGLDDVKKRIVAAGYATEDSAKDGAAITNAVAEEQVLKEQREVLQINMQRLKTLSQLTGRKAPTDLKGTTVVSVGGGPGDGICEPWFPRLASLVGAHAINFDYSQAHPLDAEMNLYEHRGGGSGDIFQLLLNNVTIRDALANQPNISIIECNNLIGNNVSPDLFATTGELNVNKDDPRIIEMRNNLRSAAGQLLADNGVLAIDDAYYVKRAGQLTPVDANGQVRHTAIFSEEQVSSPTV